MKKYIPDSPSPIPEYRTDGVSVSLKRAGGNTEAMMSVPAGAALTLKNITLDGGAVWSGGVRNQGGGVLTMEGGIIKDCYFREGGIMNVCKPGYGTGSNPSVTVSVGSITGCMSRQKGAAIQTIYGGAATVVASGASVTGCRSLHDLGALSVEEGGMLQITGGSVDAGGGQNAVYLYNQYSAEDYAGAATKPFIEGKAPGRLMVSGSPAVTGRIHVGDSCYVVDTASLAPSSLWYGVYADLTGHTGTSLTLDFTGGGKSFGKVEECGSVAPQYPQAASGGASNVFYLETETDGKTVLTRGGYALEFSQIEPNRLTVSGTCDESVTGFTVKIGEQTVSLTVKKGVLSGEIVFTGDEGTAAFASTLIPVYGDTETGFAGPTLDVLLHNSAGRTFTAPAGTAYLTDTGAYKTFTGGTLPEDAALDGGNAAFRVGDSLITVPMGPSENAPTLIASAGILSLVIGLGAQSLVADIIAGLFIVLEGENQVGDIVVIDDWRGTVQEIGVRTTKIVDAGGNVKIINNSAISSIVNQTQELSVAKAYISIEYGESIPHVERIINENLKDIREHISSIVDGPFYKGVNALAASSVDLLFVAKCKEGDVYQIQRDLNRELKLMFDSSHINVPFPQIALNEPTVFEEQPEAPIDTRSFVDDQRRRSKGIEEKTN